MSNEIQKPTCSELLDGMTRIHRESVDDWRHGSSIFQVFKRESDNTYWSASYRKSGDGEYNGLRENEADIDRVYPHTVTVVSVEYKSTPQEPVK